MTGPGASTLRVTVAIPTFRRPERLGLLLDALPARLAEVPEVEVDVLVVDNDRDGSGEPAIDGRALQVRYVREPTPGIAAVRNRVLDECGESDLIAFIDDDELPRPLWLASLLTTWRAHRSSAVMGRVISMFDDDDVDPWVIATGTFTRIPRPTGTPLEAAAAGNLLVDVAQVSSFGVRFDESLGLGGGEDTLFSRQLVARGGTIVYCAESEAEDYVVAERLTRSWAKQRAFSSGNSGAFAQLVLTERPVERRVLRLRLLSGGLLRMAAGTSRLCAGRLIGHLRHDARGTRTHFRGRGMVAAVLGHRHEEYARTSQASS